MSRIRITLVLLLTAACAHAQWRMQDSGSTASFRGIHAVTPAIAWASGTEGTVLRTTDGGAHWQKCAVPDGAEKLDFRAIWAWSANDALIMSAGPGDQSRVYGTTDGCSHWTLMHRNVDKSGFWDGLVFNDRDGILLGDPVSGKFFTETFARGSGWSRASRPCSARDGEAAFAASNSSAFVFGRYQYILGTGGKGGPRALLSPELAKQKECLGSPVPLASGNESSGVFSLFFRDRKHGVAVGGDYQKPNVSAGTAAFTNDGGLHWTAASQPPHGYRSAVTWDRSHKAWIAVGTNGTDISFDDGKNWKQIADGNWNAVSLPFAVGPKGRIGKIEDSALGRTVQPSR